MIVSVRRKCDTNKDVVQVAGVFAQMVSRVMNKSYVSGENHQCVNAVVKQYGTLQSLYFYSSRKQSLYGHPLLFMKANQV